MSDKNFMVTRAALAELRRRETAQRRFVRDYERALAVAHEFTASPRRAEALALMALAALNCHAP